MAGPADARWVAESKIARLEAVLFVAKEPLSSRKLGQFASLADGTEARTLIRRLNRRYDSRGFAFRAVEVGGGFQLMTRSKFGPWLRRLDHGQAATRLSVPAMETLAVIAYRQPVPRAELEAIRGVQCGELVRQLLDRGLVRIAGRADELGRPFLYTTTKRFLQVFGLRHLDELPHAERLRTTSSRPTSPALPADKLDEDNPGGPRITELAPQTDTSKEFEVKTDSSAALDLEKLFGRSPTMIGASKRRKEEEEAEEEADEDEEEEDDDNGDDDDEDEDEDEWEEVDDEEDDDEDWDEDDEWDEDEDDWEDDEDDDWDDEEDEDDLEEEEEDDKE